MKKKVLYTFLVLVISVIFISLVIIMCNSTKIQKPADEITNGFLGKEYYMLNGKEMNVIISILYQSFLFSILFTIGILLINKFYSKKNI